MENASSLTTGVSSIDLGPDSIVDSVIKNPPVPDPVVYEPKIQTSYPEPMIYYKFEVENDGDAGVIFFKPDNFDINSNPNDTLYSFYFSSVYFPRSSDFEVVVSAANWSTEDDGFKIFLDGGVCNEGICYMGIKLGQGKIIACICLVFFFNITPISFTPEKGFHFYWAEKGKKKPHIHFWQFFQAFLFEKLCYFSRFSLLPWFKDTIVSVSSEE